MDSQTLLVLLLILVAIAVVLLAVLVLRRPEARIGDLLERALRDEQREGRSELREQLEGLSRAQEVRIDGFARSLADLSTRTDQRLDVLRDTLSEDARKGRLESAESQQRFADALGQRLNELTQRNEQRIGEMRATLEGRLKELQADNAQKLEQMRATVDEKLQATLTQRLDASFSLVSERLEAVQRGLGEMQQLATGVGDLKRVLTNVKDRGGWGEVQLENLLEQVLTAEQFARSVKVRPEGNEAVDFAIRLPGRQDGDVPVWLPIDAKFPIEDYQRLIDAVEPVAIEEAAKAIETRLKNEARSIRDKYVAPPHTTDFAVLYLPIEGLYAEALRRPALSETLQRDYRVTLAGPTTLAAMLNSLQMGFRTLAIEQRSAEVWAVLGAVKTEFGKFGEALAHTKKKLDEASNSISKAEVRTRQLSRKLKEVEALPAADSEQLIGVGDFDGEDE